MQANTVHATLKQYFKPLFVSLPGSAARICQMRLRDNYNLKIINFHMVWMQVQLTGPLFFKDIININILLIYSKKTCC